MAETFAQRTRTVNAAIRRVRQTYRRADSKGEQVERELDRLILRKTIVTPESMLRLANLYDAYTKEVGQIESALTDAIRVSGSYA